MELRFVRAVATLAILSTDTFEADRKYAPGCLRRARAAGLG